MATLGFVQVAVDSSGKRLRTTIVEDASTVHQEVMNLAGSTGDLIEPFSQIPSSSAIAYGFRLITGSTSVVAGSVAVSNNVTILGSGSSAVMGSVLVTTGLGGAAIDVRQATIVGGTSGAGLGTILSTAAGSAAIDPRIIAPGSTIDVRVIGAASSGILGTVLSATGLGASAIDPRQATIVGGTSGAGLGTILSTGAGGAAIDARARTWTLSTAESVAIVGAGTSSLVGGVLISTAAGQAAIDPRIIAAQATSVVLGTVAVQQSTSYVSVERYFADSTSNYNQLYYWTTGIVAAAAATMQSLNLTKNLSSGSSGTSFNVAAGKIFRIDHIEGSIRVSSGTDLYADFAIRAVTSTGGASGSNFPVFYHRINANAESTNALAIGGGGGSFNMNGLSIDLPSSASYGVSITSNSTASQECTFAFGGKEFTI